MDKYMHFKNYLHLGDSCLLHMPSGHVFEVPLDDVRATYEVTFEEVFEGKEYINSALLIAKNNDDVLAVTSVFRVWTNEFPKTELVKGYESSLFTFEGANMCTFVEVCTDQDRRLAVLSNGETVDTRLALVRLDGKSRPVTLFTSLRHHLC